MRPSLRPLTRGAVAALLASLLGVALADPAALDASLDRLLTLKPAAATGAVVVVPDSFLRPWDPLTLFFNRDLGPAAGGPEDAPERYVKLSLDQPGAWQWLDARTLQLRPVEPWPPLATVKVQAGPDRFVLHSLVSTPTTTLPAQDAQTAGPVDRITLTFDRPVPAQALAALLTVELRELPGVGGAPVRTLGPGDFEVKALDRASADEEARYVLRLDTPIPLGQRAELRLRLHPEDTGAPVTVLRFQTPPAFRPQAMGCPGALLPLAPGGVRYGREQALACDGEDPRLFVQFTSPPQAIGPVEARNLVRIEPDVRDLEVHLSGTQLELRGAFAYETLYRVRLQPTALTDTAGMPLEMSAPSELSLSFSRPQPWLRVAQGEGVAERFGPQHLPIEGRGHARADLRIYKVDPEDRRFWPFPAEPISAYDQEGPSKIDRRPGPRTEATQDPGGWEIAEQLRNLPSPPISTLVDLPVDTRGEARFGLDLGPHLRRLSGKDRPGTYLVGLRALDDSAPRQWMRLQVTDLSLTTVEEPEAVVFAVTRLSSGRPVGGAEVRLEGVVHSDDAERWEVLAQGRTDARGQWRWAAPGPDPQGQTWRTERRLIVREGDDALVLHPERAPDRFADNQWSPTWDGWFSWAFNELEGRAEAPTTQVHLFAERPVIRPEEPVYLRGWARVRHQGRLSVPSGEGHIVVEGPGGMLWRLPVTLSATGGFFARFEETEPPTGAYRAWYEDAEGAAWGDARFRIEAYRIPTFEVNLHAQDQVPVDQPFTVKLTAAAYAGGNLAGRPVLWRVSRYPTTWTPPAREGYLYSSDGRYSQAARFEARPTVEEPGTTDAQGSAGITLDPSAELDAQPASYVIEATVTGADDQTVTATQRVLALPPFVLGLKVPRYLEQATSIPVELLAVDAAGKPIAGQELTLRLTRRSWHAHLQTSDFSEGEARYVSEVVDELVTERRVLSAAQPVALELPIDRAGVWLVEVEGRDRLGRVQVVGADLYAGGGGAVGWERPSVPVFEVSADAESYEPGQTATLVLRSPYQQAEALVVVEAPDGNRYQWVSVRGGQATVRLAVEERWTPRLPVHVVLMRGRAQAPASQATPTPGLPDPSRPATLAATAWLTVKPIAHQLTVELEHPERALPGQTVDVRVRLKDPKGRPLAGELTLWLVDAAVLSLGREQRLDPVPDFLAAVWSRLWVRDTRNSVLGRLPWATMPGGDGGAEEEGDPLDRATVRKDFRSVPFYEPSIAVPASGVVTVKVPLPDNVTTFKVRAKAVSGPQRFGAAGSALVVRLPVVAQPALPRFARSGDRFEAVALGQVVEGPGGAGTARLEAQGVQLTGPERRELSLSPGSPTRLSWPVTVSEPGWTAEGQPTHDSLRFKVALARAADGAADAFEVNIPLRGDREPVIEAALFSLAAGQTLALDAVAARPGTLRRELLLSADPAALRVLAGVDALISRREGSTEERVAQVRALLALRRAWDWLGVDEGQARADAEVKALLDWLPQVLDDRGLAAFWPGGTGRVALSAWTLSALMEARHAGYRVEDGLIEALARGLERGLRSDQPWFIDGEAYTERAMALAALASTGRADPAYFATLSREARWQDAEGVANLLLAGALSGQVPAASLEPLQALLSEQVLVRLFEGRERYAGLKAGPSPRNPLILPSEARSIAAISRALQRVAPAHPRLPVLYEALIQLGQGGGWGSTNADTEAIQALVARLEQPAAPPQGALLVRGGGIDGTLALGGQAVARQLTRDGSALELSAAQGEALGLRVQSRYLPAQPGAEAPAEAQGLVVQRELWRILPGGAPPERLPLEAAGQRLVWEVGEVVEDRLRVIVPEERHHVVLSLPIAAGLELLNPALLTAPPEARPSSAPTRAPDYVMVLDDRALVFYETLPRGTWELAWRARATTPGTFTQPPATARAQYQPGVWGQSAGAWVEVRPRPAAP